MVEKLPAATHLPRLSALLQQGVADGVFPGAVAGLLRVGGASPLHMGAAGCLEPGGEAVGIRTVYDLASLTKPLVATALLRWSEEERADLDAPLAAWLPAVEGTPVARRTVRSLLHHRSGLAAWAPFFEAQPHVHGSPASHAWFVSSAAHAVEQSGAVCATCYSDLGYVLLGEALAARTGWNLPEAVENLVLLPLGLSDQLFFPLGRSTEGPSGLRGQVAPTELCRWRGRVLHGEVHDENAASLGGAAGHAGAFGTMEGVMAFAVAFQRSVLGETGLWSRDLAQRSLPPAGGGYGLGWDAGRRGSVAAGLRMGPRTFGHLGYTGCSVFLDPDSGWVAVLLSNRVHPSRENIKIRQFRPWFHDHAMDAVEDSP